MKRIKIVFDGEKATVESSGYPGMSCLSDLNSLNLPYKVEQDTPLPSKGVTVVSATKTAV